MQSLSLHSVKYVKITPTQEYNDFHWKRMIIKHEGGYIEVVLFFDGTNIPIEYVNHLGALVDD